jgi:hypothetical protein
MNSVGSKAPTVLKKNMLNWMEAALVHKNNPLYGMPLRAFDVEQF